MLRRHSSDAFEARKRRNQSAPVLSERRVQVAVHSRGIVRRWTTDVLLQGRGLLDGLTGAVRGVANDLTSVSRLCLAGGGDCAVNPVNDGRGVATPAPTTSRGIAAYTPSSSSPATSPAPAPASTPSSSPSVVNNPVVNTSPSPAAPQASANTPESGSSGEESSGNSGSGGSDGEDGGTGNGNAAGSGASSSQWVAGQNGQNYVSTQTSGPSAIAAASSAASVASRSSVLAQAASSLSQGAAITLTDAQGSVATLSGTAAAASLVSSLSAFLTANPSLPTNLGAVTESERMTMRGFTAGDAEASATASGAGGDLVDGGGDAGRSLAGPIIGALVGVLVLTAGLWFLLFRRRRRTRAGKTLDSISQSGTTRPPSPTFSSFPVTFPSRPSLSPTTPHDSTVLATPVTLPTPARQTSSLPSFGRLSRGSGNSKSLRTSVFSDGIARLRPLSPTYSSEDLLAYDHDGDATIIDDPFRRSHLIINPSPISPRRPSSLLPYDTDATSPVETGCSSARDSFASAWGTNRESTSSSYADDASELDPFRDTLPERTRMGREGVRSPALDLRARLARMSQASDGSSQVETRAGHASSGTSILDFASE